MNDDLYDALWWLWNNRAVKNTPFVFICTIPGKYYGQPFVTPEKVYEVTVQKGWNKTFWFSRPPTLRPLYTGGQGQGFTEGSTKVLQA